MEFRHVSVNGHRIRTAFRKARGYTDAPPLLICNGIGASLELLLPFVEALHDVDVILFDVPGVGGSATPMLPYRFCTLARTVAGLLDELGYDNVDVLGISWGGGLAQQFALDFPRRCRRLVLVATTMGMFMVPGDPRAMMQLVTPSRFRNPNQLAAMAGQLYGGLFRTDPVQAWSSLRAIEPVDELGFLWQLCAVWGWTSIHRIHRLNQPTLIVAGTDDPIVPAVNGRIMAKLLPRARLKMLDCGHLALVTRADAAAATVRGFLSEELVEDATTVNPRTGDSEQTHA